jgi:hypothetical protein
MVIQVEQYLGSLPAMNVVQKNERFMQSKIRFVVGIKRSA